MEQTEKKKRKYNKGLAYCKLFNKYIYLASLGWLTIDEGSLLCGIDRETFRRHVLSEVELRIKERGKGIGFEPVTEEERAKQLFAEIEAERVGGENE